MEPVQNQGQSINPSTDISQSKKAALKKLNAKIDSAFNNLVPKNPSIQTQNRSTNYSTNISQSKKASLKKLNAKIDSIYMNTHSPKTTSPVGVSDIWDPITPIESFSKEIESSINVEKTPTVPTKEAQQILNTLKFYYDEPTPITLERLNTVIEMDAFLIEKYGTPMAQKKYLDYLDAVKQHQKFPEQNPKPETLDLSGCWLTTIPKCILEENPKIISIDLSRNQILEIPKGSLPPDLKFLDLCDNKLTKAPDLSELPKLEVLDLSYNEISHFSLKDRPEGLQVLFLDGNDQIDPNIIKVTEDVNRKKKEGISQNQISDSSPEDLLLSLEENLTSIESFSKEVESSINVEQAPSVPVEEDQKILNTLKFFYDEPTPITPERLNALIKMDAFLIEEYGSPMAQKKYLDYLDAVKQHQKFPEQNPKPETLDLSRCLLTTIPRCILNENPKITSIDLSWNQISEIPKGSLPPDLKHLDLSENKLTGAPNLLELPKLEVLDLSYNEISHFSLKDRPERLKVLFLDGNDQIDPNIIKVTEDVNRKKIGQSSINVEQAPTVPTGEAQKILNALNFLYNEPTPITQESLELVCSMDAFLTEKYGTPEGRDRYLAYTKAVEQHRKFPDKFEEPVYLNLKRCGLKAIPKCLSNEKLKVISLDLNMNEISEIPKGSLPPGLEDLYLGHNYFTEVPDLSELPEKLQNLDLSFNRISDEHPSRNQQKEGLTISLYHQNLK